MSALADTNIVDTTIKNADTRVLSRFEERRLFDRLAKGDKSARDQLFEHNLRLVASISFKYARPGFTREESFQEGALGLLHSIDLFDPSKGLKLSTYATYWIRHYCQRAGHKQARMVRLPVHKEEHLGRVWRAQTKLMTELGRPVTHDEIADELGEDRDMIAELIRSSDDIGSLNFPIGEDGLEVGDLIPDTRDEYGEVDERVTNEVLYTAMEKVLDERQQDLIKRRFGLEGRKPQTLHEIGLDWNVTRERMRQVEEQSLELLKLPCLWNVINYHSTPTSVVEPKRRIPRGMRRRKRRPSVSRASR